MDDLAALVMQIELGADEALVDRPVDRRVTARPVPPAPVAGYVPTAAALPAGGTVTALARAQTAAAAAMDLVGLRAAVADFEDCALRNTATTLVFAEGDPGAPVMLVADVPGPAEDRAGVPFAGAGGVFLDRMLASIGLDRGQTYATSLLPWRPPGDRKPADAEVQLCLPFLLRHLALVQPSRLVLLGSLVARALLPASTGRRTQQIFQSVTISGVTAPVQIIALGSLSAIQANPLAKQDAWTALLRLRRSLDEDATNG